MQKEKPSWNPRANAATNRRRPVNWMHTPADNLQNAGFKMQFDCICCKSYYYGADEFLLNTKQSIAMSIASFQKL